MIKINWNRRLFTGIALLFVVGLQAQGRYFLDGFRLVQQVDQRDSSHQLMSQGIAIQFNYHPLQCRDNTLEFEVQLWSKEQQVAIKQFNVEYQISDSLIQRIDSVGIDSVSGLDTLVSLYLPYRSIALEQGTHSLQIKLSDRQQTIDLFQRTELFEQHKIYDVFFDLSTAILRQDADANPIGLGYFAPDPQWLIRVGKTTTLKGPIQRNSFALKSHQVHTTCTDSDALSVCIFDSDPSAKAIITCYDIPAQKEAYRQAFSDTVGSKSYQQLSFSLNKLERKPVSTVFEVQENYLHKGLRGLKIDFSYDLPLYYKRKSIRIHLLNELDLALNDWVTLTANRQQKEHRIIAQYQYFIPNFSLQKLEQVRLQLQANNVLLKAHQTDHLAINIPVKATTIGQQVAYQHRGVSGVLYQFNARFFEQLPSASQLELHFPSIAKSTSASFMYWFAQDTAQLYQGQSIILNPSVRYHQIFVFVPYFVVPNQIQLQPQLLLKVPFYKSLLLHQFESAAYRKPNSINDVQLVAQEVQKRVYQGLAGQQFVFQLQIPDYYHSKGTLSLRLMEDDVLFEGFYFLDQQLGKLNHTPLYNQTEVRVFIPFRWMQKGKKYRLEMQAQYQQFALSEKRSLSYHYKMDASQKATLYVENLWLKEGDSASIKIGIRNNKVFNSTYPDLSYQYINQGVYGSSNKAQKPLAIAIEVHPLDEINLWIVLHGVSKPTEYRLRTSLAALKESHNLLEVKQKELLKLFRLKLSQQ